ncbi:carbohydrate ABC transporter permease [Nonomuraea sp. ATR24]|uniref:carbohydrate ABC transporter permease n=1 Tax=Nonomuraea TaxID=83681 RepID=UPI001C5D2A53|nr:sugar ABC transporter permease [Nonomuraea ceibae]
MTVLTRKARPVAAGPPATARTRRARERAWALAFASPYLLHLVALTAWPVLASLFFSMTDYDLMSPPTFVGFGNFSRLLGDEVFWRTLGNTAYFAVLFVPTQTALALLLAMALNQRLRGMALFRAAYFVPVVSSWVVVAYVADSVFNPQTGIANQVLALVGLPAENWLQDPALVIPTLAAVAVWKGVGYMMVLFLAGLQAIPEERYEAAKIDGASAWNRFRYITLPGISGTTFLVLVLTSIETLQSFEQVYVMTDGGPHGASELTVLYLYRQGFQFFQMGYASAVAWVLFVLVLVLTLVQFRLQRRWVHYA